MRETEFESEAIEFFEHCGLMVYKPPKFHGRKKGRKNDLGAPDIFIFHKSLAIGVEFKTKVGVISDDQHSFSARFRSNGCLYFICRSIDEAEAIYRHIRGGVYSQ